MVDGRALDRERLRIPAFLSDGHSRIVLITLPADLRHGLRLLARSPGFTVAAVMALALGIGASTAMFTVVNTVLFRPLPYTRADRLVMVREHRQQREFERTVVAPGEFIEWAARSTTTEDMAAVEFPSLSIAAAGEVQAVSGLRVTASFFPLLDVRPALGRVFTAGEDRPGSNQVVLVSHAFWRDRLSGNAAILGRGLTIDGQQYTLVGVLPSGFSFFGQVDAIVPQAFGADAATEFSDHYLDVIARLKDGIDRAPAEADITGVARNGTDFIPHALGVALVPLQDAVVGNVRAPMLILFGCVGLVLLIASTNIANLLLTRAVGRQKELAIRTALGAGRARLAGQLLAESLMLSSIGGGLGFLLSLWAVDLIVRMSPAGTPRLTEIGPDFRVLLFTLFVSVGTGVLFGSAPAWFASRTDVNASLKLEGRGSGPGGRRRILGAFVISEVALALLLLIAAGLLLVSFDRLRSVDPGFDASNVLTLDVNLPDWKYRDAPAQRAFVDRLAADVRSIPGVRAAGFTNILPLSGNNSSGTITVEGRPAPPGNARLNANLRRVSPGYFQAMRLPLLRGRFPGDRDTADTLPVAAISATMAARFWPNEDPIGRRFKIGGQESDRPWMTIVGIVGDLHHQALDVEPRQEMYRPLQQDPAGTMALAIRTAGDPLSIAPAVRQRVRAIDPGLPVSSLQTMQALVDASTSSQAFQTTLLALFAGAALLLAVSGIYGVMAHAVSQRTQEIGVRMALGAAPHDVLRLVALEGLRLTGWGVAAGLVAALMATRLLSSLLFGVSATNPWVLAGATLALVGAALAGSMIPARRASRVDPLIALGRS